jgi:hypothetical protein
MADLRTTKGISDEIPFVCRLCLQLRCDYLTPAVSSSIAVVTDLGRSIG